jgi:hypothetical protein
VKPVFSNLTDSGFVCSSLILSGLILLDLILLDLILLGQDYASLNYSSPYKILEFPFKSCSAVHSASKKVKSSSFCNCSSANPMIRRP